MSLSRELEKFQEYKVDIEKSKKRMFEAGEMFFIREDPNEKSLYGTRWQVGIGKEKKSLIDHHVAKCWNKDEAHLMARILNATYTTNLLEESRIKKQ